ncbi:MAG TPA: hypothetical protein VGO93_30460, partial [Candidatus Xenobia bacterium]
TMLSAPDTTTLPPAPAPPDTLAHKPLKVKAEALTPDSKRYMAVGLLKESRLKTVSLVVEKASGKPLVAYQVHLPPRMSPDEIRQRLEKTGTSLARLSHPRIPPFLGYQSTATGHWLLFEFVDGFPLDAYESECLMISDDWVVWWFHQMLHLLADLHLTGLRVGGFAPRHLLVSQQNLCLVHLGLIESLHPMAALGSPQKLPFAAPEHTGSVQTVPSDLYSAAAVAWWLVTGFPPVPMPGLTLSVVQGVIKKIRPDFPPPAMLVLSRLLQINPAERYASADEAIQALSPGVPVMDVLVRPPQAPTKIQIRFFGEETMAKLDRKAAALESKAAAASLPKAPAAPKAAPAEAELRAALAPPVAMPGAPVRPAQRRLPPWTKWGMAGALVILTAGVLRLPFRGQQPTTTVSAAPTEHPLAVRSDPAGSSSPGQPGPDLSGQPVDEQPELLQSAGGSSIRLDAGSNYEMAQGTLHLTSGQAEVEATSTDQVNLRLPTGEVHCQPGSKVEVTVNDMGMSRIHCDAGQVRYQSASGLSTLGPGESVTLAAPPPSRQ